MYPDGTSPRDSAKNIIADHATKIRGIYNEIQAGVATYNHMSVVTNILQEAENVIQENEFDANISRDFMAAIFSIDYESAPVLWESIAHRYTDHCLTNPEWIKVVFDDASLVDANAFYLLSVGIFNNLASNLSLREKDSQIKPFEFLVETLVENCSSQNVLAMSFGMSHLDLIFSNQMLLDVFPDLVAHIHVDDKMESMFSPETYEEASVDTLYKQFQFIKSVLTDKDRGIATAYPHYKAQIEKFCVVLEARVKSAMNAINNTSKNYTND